jgi:phosphatidylinositol alpha-1,6-mannosyltransferase
MSVERGGELRLLATAYDYRPRLGGVATCAYGLLGALARREAVRVRLLARAHPEGAAFDRHGAFETARVPLPELAPLAAAALAPRLALEAARFRPHAIVNSLWLPDGLASLSLGPARAAGRLPYFVLAHGVEVLESRRSRRKRLRGLLSPLKRAVFRAATGVFAVSRYTRDRVIDETGIDEARVHVVHNGVDVERFAPRSRAPDLVDRHGLASRRVLLTVARLEDYKGVDRAIAALRHVVARHRDALYLVCGDGPDRSRLEALARHYRVRDHVVFAGAVPEERLPDYYSLADCFVLLSREDRDAPNVEGFGIVFLEAAACAKPAIAGRSGGIADAVVDGRTGWLVDPWDDAAVGAAMLEALGDPAGLSRRGEAARERARAELTWDAMAGRVLEVVRRHVRD